LREIQRCHTGYYKTLYWRKNPASAVLDNRQHGTRRQASAGQTFASRASAQRLSALTSKQLIRGAGKSTTGIAPTRLTGDRCRQTLSSSGVCQKVTQAFIL